MANAVSETDTPMKKKSHNEDENVTSLVTSLPLEVSIISLKKKRKKKNLPHAARQGDWLLNSQDAIFKHILSLLFCPHGALL